MFARDYRRAAWEKLKGNWGTVVLSFLIYTLIVVALSAFGGIGALILGGPLTVGFAAVMLTLVRTGSTKIELLFDDISTDFVSRMLAYILSSIYLMLWSFLFVIPGIVKYYSYSMTYYILRDNPGIGANEAITRSRQMMDGHKWQLFCLEFSYIGWILLCALCGVAVLWVAPYMEAAKATFYESIKNGDNPPVQDAPASAAEGGTEAI